jgi:hypothetical protein
VDAVTGECSDGADRSAGCLLWQESASDRNLPLAGMQRGRGYLPPANETPTTSRHPEGITNEWEKLTP